MLNDVHAQHKTIVPSKILQAVDGSVCSFANAIRVTVGDEALFEQWLNDVTQSVMNNAIAKRRGADLAMFGFMDGKVGVFPRLIRPGDQLSLQCQQMIGHAIFETGRAGFAPLAFGGLAIGKPEIIPIHDRGKHG